MSIWSCFNFRKQAILAANAFCLLAWTVVLRRVPPPSPTPSDLALWTYLMPKSLRASAISQPSLASQAVHTDLVLETSMPSSSIIVQTSLRKPISMSRAWVRLAVISAERSST